MDEDQKVRKLCGDPAFGVCIDFNGQAFEAFVGDRDHASLVSHQTPTLAAAIEWVESQVSERYPHSQYVQELLGA